MSAFRGHQTRLRRIKLRTDLAFRAGLASPARVVSCALGLVTQRAAILARLGPGFERTLVPV